MPQYVCKINSTAGLRGKVIALQDAERARSLVERGVIAPYEAPQPEAEKPKRRKKGGSAQDANPRETIEYKD